jgi:hypothetical protein
MIVRRNGELMLTKEDAMRYLRFAVDDAMTERNIMDMPKDARLVVYLCGRKPVTVAVWSYLQDTQGNPSRIDDVEAEELAGDLLNEHAFFGDVAELPIADFVI